jgi:hypothetical protein
MKIIPVQSPGQIPTNGTPESVRTAKAVAAFNKGASSFDKSAAASQQSTAQEHPVLNANAVSVEELGAIQSQVAESSDKNTEELEASEVNEESNTTPEPEKPKADPALSRQFAQLARQERALRAKVQQQAQEFKAQQDAFKAEKSAFDAKAKQYETGYVSIERFKADPLAVMAETGMSYDQLTQQLLNQQPRDPRVDATISRLEAKIKSLEEANDTNQKSYQQQQQDAYNAAVKQIQLDARNLVKSDPVAYEAISKTGSIKDVVELITETYNKDGVLLTVEEAAEQVENYLVEEGLNTVTKIDKIKNRMQMNASSNAKKAQSPTTQKQSQPMKTLTNASSSQRQLSAKERAILAFKGELKS